MSNYLALPIAALLVSLCSVAAAVESADPMRPDDYARKMADDKGAKVTTKNRPPSVTGYNRYRSAMAREVPPSTVDY